MRKVLIVDDEADYRHLLALHLSREGYEVKVAATGREAIALGAHFRPKVLVADWLLKNHIHGLRVAEVLRTVAPELLTILITGFSSHDLKAEADKLHVHAFVEKPFDLDDLLQTVEQAARIELPAAQPPPIAVLEVDTRGGIHYANTPAQELLTHSAVGQPTTQMASVLGCDVPTLLAHASTQWCDVDLPTPALQRWALRARVLPEAERLLLVLVPGQTPHFTNDPITRMLLDLPEPASLQWPFHGPALIIDDYELHRRLITHVLELAGCVCHSARTYTEGLRLFVRDPTISVVVIADNAYEPQWRDLRQLVNALRAIRPDVSLVGTSVEDRRQAFATVGVSRFLLKPWKASDLLTVLT
jgi:DNA-binding NtrC family response regulator